MILYNYLKDYFNAYQIKDQELRTKTLSDLDQRYRLFRFPAIELVGDKVNFGFLHRQQFDFVQVENQSPKSNTGLRRADELEYYLILDKLIKFFHMGDDALKILTPVIGIYVDTNGDAWIEVRKSEGSVNDFYYLHIQSNIPSPVFKI